MFSRRSWRRPDPGTVAALALAGLVLLLFRGAVFEGRVFHKRDIHLVWHPQVEAFVRAVAFGSWPVWDPSPSFGQPLLADPSAQVLYPPTWLNLILRPWTYYTMFAVSHTLFSALGLYALARRFELSRPASTLAAALWITCGPFVSYLDLWHHFAGAAWIPWVILAAEGALQKPGTRSALLWGGATAAQILAGSADMVALTLAAVGASVLLRHWRFERAAFARNARLAGVAAAAGTLGLGLSAPLWLTALELVGRSGRSSLPESVRTYWSVHPFTLVECLTPGLWSGLPLSASLRQALFESREPFLFTLYLGLPATALVAAGVAFGPRPLKRLLVVLILGSVLLALGRHTPAYHVAVLVVPVLKVLRYPVKAMILVAFAWSLLAGMGLDAWLRPGTTPRGWLSRVALPPLVLGLLATGAAFYTRGHATALAQRLLSTTAQAEIVFVPTVVKLVVGGALGLTAAALALARWRFSARGPALAVAILAVADLFTLHREPSPLAPRALYTHRPEVLESLRSAQRVYVYDYTLQGKALEHLGKPSPTLARMPEGWRLDEATDLASQLYLASPTLGRWGLRAGFEVDYRGLYPLYLSQLSQLVRVFEAGPEVARLMRLGGISHVVALHERGFESLRPLATLPGLLEQPIRVFEVPDPLPRAFVVGGASVRTDRDVLSAFLDPAFDPLQEVLLSEGRALPQRDVDGSAKIVEDRADRVRIEATLKSDGYLVLLDSYDPNWRATVDGGEARVRRANFAFRAVELPPGRHLVELRYRPWALSLGLAVSGLSLGAALLAWRFSPA